MGKTMKKEITITALLLVVAAALVLGINMAGGSYEESDAKKFVLEDLNASIETFVNHGEISATRFVLPHENGLSVKAEGGPVTIHSLITYQLNSAWSEALGRSRN